MEKKKVRIYRQHVAYVNTELREAFCARFNISDFDAWTEQMIAHEWGRSIREPGAIQEFSLYLKGHYYDDIGEYLQERMRYCLKHPDVFTNFFPSEISAL